MSKSRLEAFADGVFAIAATLLVLSVDAQVPSGSRGFRRLRARYAGCRARAARRVISARMKGRQSYKAGARSGG